MSDFVLTDVSGMPGGVHTGPGNQYIHNHFSGPFTRTRPAQAPRKVAEDELSWLRQRFESPGHLGKAREVLAAESMAIIRGPSGSGRTAAARILLHELRAGPGAFYELPAEDDEGQQARDLMSVKVGQGDRLLLNLSDAQARFWPSVQAQLSAFRSTLKAQQAHLTVVLQALPAGPLPDGLGRFEAVIEPPARERVLRKHLRAAGFSAEEILEMPPVLAPFLGRNPPLREVAAVADLVVRARADAPDGSFDQWCAVAVEAARDRAGEVATLMARLRKGPLRALLLAAAMLHEAHGDAVHRGARALLTGMRHPPDERPELERADLLQRLAKVKAHVNADGQVHFDDLGFDEAVRRHFWLYLPEVRDVLCAWAGEGVSAPELTDGDRDALVTRLAQQCLSTRGRQQLCDLVTRWASSGDGPRLRAAAKALQCGLEHDSQASFFRRRIYEWSLDTRGPSGVKDVLVDVCANVMAVHHPDQALVRLHHLARRQPRRAAAHEALLNLTDDDHRLYRLLINRLSSAPMDRVWEADLDLFADLADPCRLTKASGADRPLLTETAVQHDFSRIWNRVFVHRPFPKWQALTDRWFDAADEDAEGRDLLISTLVDGCDQAVEHLGRLYTAVRSWAQRSDSAAATAPLAVTDLLRQKIDAAQCYPAA